MNIYSIVYNGVIAQYEAMALIQDAVPNGGPAAGMMMRAQGRQVAPIYASVAQSATDRATQAGPATSTSAGPVPLPTFNFPSPGAADASGWPAPSGMAGLPGLPLPGLPLPGLPGVPSLPGFPAMPAMPSPPGPSLFSVLANTPGLDVGAFLKCLASSLPCACKPGSPSGEGGQGPDSDPVQHLLDQALGIFERARQLTDAAAKEAEQRVTDLKAAAASASELRRKAISESQKLAEERLREAKRRGEGISTAVGNVLAHFPR